MPVPSGRRSYGLDQLRAAAIGLVLISHFSLVFGDLIDPTPVVQTTGFFGVELFFVLSGFLIGQILLRTVLVSPTSPTLRNFWARRWLRTLPAYFLVITVLLGLSRAGLWPPAFDWRFLSFYVFFQNVFSPDVWEGFFGVGWSLVIEEWFYLVVPLILIFGRRLLLGRDQTIVFGLCALIIVGPLVLRFVVAMATSYEWWIIRKSIAPRFDAIGYGVLIAALKTYSNDVIDGMQRRRWLCTTLAVSGIVGLSVALRSGPAVVNSLWMKTFGFSIAPFCFALLLPAFISKSANQSSSNIPRLVTFISMTSYSIYLVHWDVLQLVRRAFGQATFWSALSIIVIGLIVTIIVAFLLHASVEQYFMSLRDRKKLTPLPTRHGAPNISAPITSAVDGGRL